MNLPPVKTFGSTCQACGHPVSSASAEALLDAIRDHNDHHARLQTPDQLSETERTA